MSIVEYMGQKPSARSGLVYPTTSVDVHAGELKKAGSLATIANHGRLTGKREKAGTLRRTQSFDRQQELEEAKKRLLERAEREANVLNDWVSSRDCKVSQPSSLVELASLATAACLRTAMDVERLPCSREIKDQVEYMILPVFDETIITSDSIAVSNAGHSLVYNGKGYSTTVVKTLHNRGLSRGRYAWMFHIDKSRVQGWMQLGVVSQARWAEKCATKWDGNPHPFREGEMARRSNGNFHSGWSATEATMVHDSIYVGGYGHGDTIGIKLDMDAREISWTRNGEPYGPPARLGKGSVWPSVSLDSPGEAVSLLYFTCNVRCNQHKRLYFNPNNRHRNSIVNL